MAESTTKKRFDSMYRATKPGMRKSKKFAKIEMKDGSSFRRRNANQYGDADGGKAYTENRRNRTDRNVFLQEGGSVSDIEMQEGIEMAKRGKRISSRSKLAKEIEGDISGLLKSDSRKSIDSKLKASKAGKRRSKKFATIMKKDGTRFRRRNANQYGDAEGNKSYYEYRKNRTDKNVWLEDGGALPTMEGFTYEIGGLL